MGKPFRLLLAASLAVAGAFTLSAPALAATQGKTLTPQQQRMADCSRAAAGKKGAAYKEAVRSCMKGKATSPAATKMSPQEKMKHCSSEAKAKGLKGKEFKSSVSTCLKG